MITTIRRLFFFALLYSAFYVTPVFARCDGGSCSSCTNCSRCYHCNRDGGTCSVCAGSGSTAGTGSPHLGGDSFSNNSSGSGATSQLDEPSFVPPPTREDIERDKAWKQEQARQASQQQRELDRLNRQFRADQQVKVQATATAVSQVQQAMQPFTGKCVALSDGDTVQVMRDGRAVKVRLHGIDCPEKKQPFGTKAHQFTADAVFQKKVKVYPTDIDRYGRTVGWVFQGDKCLNRDLVSSGLAWHYKQYAPNETKLAQLETEAKVAGRGLWSDCCAVAPWDWRRGVRTAPPIAKPTPTNTPLPELEDNEPGVAPPAKPTTLSKFISHPAVMTLGTFLVIAAISIAIGKRKS